MTKKRLMKGISLILAGIMVFSVAGCNNNAKGESRAEEAKKNAKDAIFREEMQLTADFTQQGAKIRGDRFLLYAGNPGEFQFAIGDASGNLGASQTVSLESEEHYSMGNCVTLAPDGTVYFVDNFSDYTNNKYENTLIHVDADGKELGRVSLEGESNPYSVVITEDGNAVVRYDTELAVYDAGLKKVKNITNSNASQNWSELLPSGKDLLLFTYSDGIGMSAHKVDLAAGTIGPDIPFDARNGTAVAGTGYDFYSLNYSTGVYGVDLANNKTTEVFNFLDSDMSGDINVLMFDKETALVVGDPYSDNAFISIYKKVPPSEVVDKKILTLGAFYLTSDAKKLIAEFNKENPTYKIRVIDYSEFNSAENDYNGGVTAFNADATTGNIPDIMMTGGISNIQTYINKNLFADLTPLMEKAGLNKSDYLENIIEAGSKDGKLYNVIPFFYLNGHMIKKSLLNGKDGITIDEYMELEKKNNIAGKSLWYETQSAVISDAFSYNTGDFLDVSTGKCNFDSDDFKKVLIFANEFPTNTDNMEEIYKDADYNSAYMKDQLLLSSFGMGSFREAYRTEQSMFGEDVVIIGFPNIDGDSKPVINPSLSVAISAKCSDKEGAFEFVKMLLSEDFQNQIDNGYAGSRGIPILKSAFEKMGETAMEPYAYKNDQGEWVEIDPSEDTYQRGGKEYPYQNLPKERLEYYKEVCTSVSSIRYKEDQILNIINEEAAAYFAGQKSVDEVTRIIQSRASIYVKEKQ